MDKKKNTRTQNNKYLKLSLKKNRAKCDVEQNQHSYGSDVIIIDESLDKLELGTPKSVQSKLVTYSPIVVNDSSILSEDGLPHISLPDEEPSKNGNASFNCSRDNLSADQSRPSIGGWSPAQHIITADPQNDCIPTTPKDVTNKSHENCTIKTIEKSQKKILTDLYGNAWKSIPHLFKTISKKYENFDGISKQLFPDEDERKYNKRLVQEEKELYIKKNINIDNCDTGQKKAFSDIKKNDCNLYGTEKKSKKKLFTEKVPSTPNFPKPKIKRDANSTTKKVAIKKGMSVTELVEIMRKTENVDQSNKIDDLTSDTNKVLNGARKIDEIRKDILTNLENDSSRKENKENIVPKKGSKSKDSTKKTKLPEKVESESEKPTKYVEVLTKKLDNVCVTPQNVKRLSFVGSLAENIPTWRCHPEAFQYKDGYKTLKEQLARRLYAEFNKNIFGDAMPPDMAILWDTKFRRTAGTTTNRLVKNAKGDRIRTSMIKLSTKVVDTPERLRDTLVHEMCHAATWLIDGELRAGHGPLWKRWAKRALQVFPELGEISRCHDMDIHFKYSFKCTRCGYSIDRHSKSIDITKKCCGYCRGRFEVVVNKKNKDGVVVTTPARKATNGFALYVKENYASVKDSTKTHAQVMKILGEKYAATKNKKDEDKFDLDSD